MYGAQVPPLCKKSHVSGLANTKKRERKKKEITLKSNSSSDVSGSDLPVRLLVPAGGSSLILRKNDCATRTQCCAILTSWWLSELQAEFSLRGSQGYVSNHRTCTYQVQRQFSVSPASWFWHCRLEIWLAILTNCGVFTYSRRKFAMSVLLAKGSFHRT